MGTSQRVEHYALIGDLRAAALVGRDGSLILEAHFETARSAVANDVGLLAGEYDPVARRQLGSSPRAFSPIARVNSALNLAGARGPAGQRSVPYEPVDGPAPSARAD